MLVMMVVVRTSASAGGAAPALPGGGGGWIGEGSWVAGRYRLVERLGERGGATTWKAVDEVLARPVTVFTLAPGSRCTPDVMAAARAAARANDPRLARIFDANDTAFPVHVVTEWPSGVRFADLVAAGPLEPWQAARIIAEAAQVLAAAHEVGLAHCCLAPDCVWYGAHGEVKITGLEIDAALFGTPASDPAETDTRGLARLLYAGLTGYWPGPEQTGLPPAPRPGGRWRRAGQLRPGIPASLDQVTCRALQGEAGGDQPPITSPACLAAELAAIMPPGPPLAGQPGQAVAATLPLSPAPPLPPPSLAPAQRPVPPGARAGSGTLVTAVTGQASWPSGRPRAPGQHRPSWRKLTAVLLTVAVLAAGAGLLSHELTTSQHRGTATGGRSAASLVTITAVRAAAFGPTGEAGGDNPQLAHQAIDASAATPWHTDWYATAGFGNLQAGTGLLLDLARPVTVTQAQITLGSSTGADLQLRAGNVPTLASLRPVARVAGAGGVVRLRLIKPAHARYLLLWFTKLPPDASGTFQVGIYQVRLQGHA